MKPSLGLVACGALLGACSVLNQLDDVKPQLDEDHLAGRAGQANSAASGSAGTDSVAGTGGSPDVAPGEGGCGGKACGAGGEPEPERICVPNEPSCNGDVATICNANGNAYVGGSKCSSSQTCVHGACEDQECEPDARFCSVDSVRLCAGDGLSSAEQETCQEGSYCDEASAACKTGTCAPNQAACDGNIAKICNAQGSGYQAGGTVCASGTTCSGGQCEPHVCEPGQARCSGQDVVLCADTGLSSSVTETCTAGQYCDQTSATCKAQTCQPGEAECQGNTAVICNSLGSAKTSQPCGGNSPICVGAGVCAACTPDERRCSGLQPQNCSSAGQWVNDGSSCSGRLTCDANGSKTCTHAPIVSGGTLQLTGYAGASVSTFRLARYEVTVAEYRAFLDAYWKKSWRPASGAGKHVHLNGGQGVKIIGGGYESGWSDGAQNHLPSLRSSWEDDIMAGIATYTVSPGNNEDKPINSLDWYQAAVYCIWHDGFLPTDNEWTYAASADGTGMGARQYPWGATTPGPNADLAAWGCYFAGNGSLCTQSNVPTTGTIPAGNAFFGQSDMAGSAGEWVLDYGASPAVCADCVNGSSQDGATKGGAFDTKSVTDLQNTARASKPRDSGNYANGVRCAYAP